MSAARILVVDDDRAAAQYLSLALRDAGYAPQSVGDGVQALLAMEAEVPDLVISDLRMPEIDGLQLLTRIKQRWPEVPFILITVEDEIATVVEAIHRGALNYLVKPVSPGQLVAAAHKALSLRPTSPAVGEGVSEILGTSRCLVELRHRVLVAARSDVSVLISGETGTGKELAARAIHRCSRRSDGPFVAHNCAAIPADLFESQFFGHCRGAFTGAVGDQPGLFESADGGVLLLDELETLPPLHQAKLLRALDDGEIRRVGSTETRRVSVRVLATTNRDPEAMVNEGSLREDLYYRLRGFEIRLPPLREHPEDIPLLATHFLAGAGDGFTADALRALGAAPWPGNVRELRNVVGSALASAGRSRIGIDQLRLPPAQTRTSAGPERASDGAESGATLKELERLAIQQALESCAGNRTRAARRLGIDRSTLRRKMTEFGIATR
jgi:DNA-binding NtrC family response regulator